MAGGCPAAPCPHVTVGRPRSPRPRTPRGHGRCLRPPSLTGRAETRAGPVSEAGTGPQGPAEGPACAAPTPTFVHAQAPTAHSWKWGGLQTQAPPLCLPDALRWDSRHGNGASAKRFSVFWSLNLPTAREEARQAPGWPVTSTSLPSRHLLSEGLPERAAGCPLTFQPDALGVAATAGCSGETLVLVRLTLVHHP